MAGREEEGGQPLPAFLPPHAHAAMPPPVSHEQDEEARFWSAMHDGDDDEERQQHQLLQQPQHNHTPPSPIAPSRLSMPGFTAVAARGPEATGGEEEDGSAPLLTPVPPQPPPSSAASSSSSTGGGAGVKAGPGGKRPPRRGGGGANANGGIGGGVGGGAAGLRQSLEEMFRAITGAAGGIVCRGVEGNGARRRPGGSSSILELNRSAAQHDGFQYRRMEEEEGGEGPEGGMEEGDEDEEDGVSGWIWFGGERSMGFHSPRTDGVRHRPSVPVSNPSILITIHHNVGRRRTGAGPPWRIWTCFLRPCTGTTSIRCAQCV